jgi:hypothetical protein
MSAPDYVLSHEYEWYIRLARMCDREDFGAHNQYMLNLIDKEKGNGWVSHLKHEKILADVKKNLISATKFALTRKFSQEDKLQTQSFLEIIEQSNTAKKLLEVCEAGHELFRKYK